MTPKIGHEIVILTTSKTDFSPKMPQTHSKSQNNSPEIILLGGVVPSWAKIAKRLGRLPPYLSALLIFWTAWKDIYNSDAESNYPSIHTNWPKISVHFYLSMYLLIEQNKQTNQNSIQFILHLSHKQNHVN